MSRELRARREALESLWQQGMSGRALLKQHTSLLDGFIVESFARCHQAGSGLALVATGGYGRQELFPFSDVDLMLLYEPAMKERLNPVIEKVIYPLWDAGLEVGHSVRTVEQCVIDAQEDFFFQVSLLDNRFLAGDSRLFDHFQDSFRQEFIEGHRKLFLDKMVDFRQKRHQSFGTQSFLLEPQIKENRGGFRDIQAMLWTARVIFGLADLAAMQEAGLLLEREREQFEQAWDFLVRVRNRLHYLGARKNDQLFFEHQEKIAEALGYRSTGGLLGVERFMRDLYQHMQTVAVNSDLFFEHVHEVLGPPPDRAGQRELEPGIEIRQERLHLIDPKLLPKKPALLLRIFALAARNRVPIHHRTKKLIRESLALVDDRLRRSKRAAKSFFDLLVQDSGPQALDALLETGLLSAYIPEFAAVESLAQHDVYHVYTVDSHLLQTVAELHRLSGEEARVFATVSAPHLLFLAGLLHDIGKGQGGGHEEKGAELVAGIGARLGLAPEQCDTLAFLVRNHLFLTMTALRRDLEDEGFIMRCADRIRDPQRLAMLYLLSVADARATGPSVWNEWKGALLLELYLKIAMLLDREEVVLPDRRKGAEWMRRQIKELRPPPLELDIEELPDDYLLSFSPESVVDHIRRRQDLNYTKLAFQAVEQADHWSLLLLAQDRPGLLAKICGVLALHNINVYRAQIFTWPDGTVVDTLEVTPTINSSFAEQDWQELEHDLLAAITSRLGLTHRLHRKLQPVRRPAPRTGNGRAKVLLDNEIADTHTIIEVFSRDRPGLLYEITRTLADFEINIFQAKIVQEAEQVVDVFYVRDNYGDKILDPALKEEIRASLMFVVTGGQ